MESAEPPEPPSGRSLRHEFALIAVLGLVLCALSCWGLERHPPLSAAPAPAASVP